MKKWIFQSRNFAFTLACSVSFIGSVLVSTNLQAKFLPGQDLSVLSIPVDAPVKSNMTEPEFRQIIQRVQALYEKEVSQFGGKLQINGDWASEKLNAAARQMFGSWSVVITGGLARHPKLTPDGFTLILCHEMGHHLGGFAYTPSPAPIIPTWAANEGQADYFATQSCARRLWSSELDLNRQRAAEATDEMKTLCGLAWIDTKESAENLLCLRTLVAVRSLIATMADIKKIDMPSFSTQDQKVVDKTDSNHPHPQCRMDTALQATLCKQEFDPTQIPGRKASGGVASEAAELEAARVSCTRHSGYEIGLRPRCWFAPRM